jgi:ABC-2 type transport system ATP-binding protein
MPATYHRRVTEPLVLAESLGKRYGANVAVAEVSLAIHAGEVTAVLGPNGAGKTTSLEMCEGFRSPDSGTVRVFGRDPLHFTAAQRARVGIMLQSGGVWSTARPAETIRHVASFYRHPLDAGELIERLGLQRVSRTPFRRLSGGEQQRVKLACAVVGQPEVLFLDEPTAGLDPHARRSVWELVEQQRDRGAAVVLSTHLMDEAEQLADQIVIVHQGRVVAEGTPKELTAAAESDQILLSPGVAVDTDDLLQALPPGASIAERRAGQYAIVSDVSPSVLSAVSAWCADNGIAQHAISIQRQTLEDVFLDLTQDLTQGES